MERDHIRAGRLSEDRSADIASFLSSMDADRWIAEADLLVDIAHVTMLVEREILDKEEAQGMMRILLDFVEKGVPAEAFDIRYEDIHAGIEACLIRAAGEESGGRLHMGRSRNDEVATCIRMRLREEVIGLMGELAGLRDVLLDLAAVHQETIMPGFTHMQHAQPTTLSHHLLAFEAAFTRDFERLRHAFSRINQSPLGAAAFASTGFPIDREMTAKLLGFAGVEGNTMDAVSARDFLLEAIADCSILMTHASRCCEELIVWSSGLVQFVELPDAFCSTSSIMPQKKNPDTAEIMRGKAGTVYGSLVAALATMKGLPMSYNRDLQEVTPNLWKAISEARSSIRLLSGMYAGARFNRERMREESGRGYSTATDLADFLVREYRIPFRTAHTIVGRAVKKGGINLMMLERAALEVKGISLVDMGLTEDMIRNALDPVHAVAMRRGPGGPSPEAVRSSVKERRRLVRRDMAWLEGIRHSLSETKASLLRKAKEMLS
ncbi:MAG: argininosuccinate lyase [Methanomicrobiales archaeon]|nr:argininosuccinate lyase [Methanomicrobiales archaeon]